MVKCVEKEQYSCFHMSKQILSFLESHSTYCTNPERQRVQVIKEPQALHYWK